MTAINALQPKSAAASRRTSAQACFETRLEACSVARLADEAADLIAAWRGLQRELQAHREGFLGIGTALGERAQQDDVDEMSARDVFGDIGDRLKAIARLAQQYQAESMKGAAFQAATLNYLLCDLEEASRGSHLKGQEGQLFRDSYAQLERGLESIVPYLAKQGDGLPAHVLDYYGFSPAQRRSTAVARAKKRFSAA